MINVGAMVASLALNTKDFTAGITAMGKDATKFTSKLGKLGKTDLTPLTNSLFNLKNILIATAGAGVLGKGIKSFGDFQQSIANVGTMLRGDVGPQLDFLKLQILSLPPVLGDAEKNTMALYQALSAGIEPAEAVFFVAESAKAAKAGLTDAKTAIDGVIPVMKAFGVGSKDVTGVLDLMFEAVKQGRTTFPELASTIGRLAPSFNIAGLSIEEMLAAVSTLTTVMPTTEETIVSLRATMNTLIKPSDELAKKFKEYGIETGATALQEQGFQKILIQLNKVISEHKDEFAELFPNIRAFTGVSSLASTLSETYGENLEKMADAAGNVNGAFKLQTETLNTFFDTLKNEATRSINLLGAAFEAGLGDKIGESTEGLKSFASEFLTFAGVMVEGVRTISNAWDGMKLIVQGVWVAFSKFFSWTFTAIKDYLLTPIDGILDALQSIGVIENNPLEVMQTQFANVAGAAVDTFNQIADETAATNANFDSLQTALIDVQTAFTEGEAAYVAAAKARQEAEGGVKTAIQETGKAVKEVIELDEEAVKFKQNITDQIKEMILSEAEYKVYQMEQVLAKGEELGIEEQLMREWQYEYLMEMYREHLEAKAEALGEAEAEHAAFMAQQGLTEIQRLQVTGDLEIKELKKKYKQLIKDTKASEAEIKKIKEMEAKETAAIQKQVDNDITAYRKQVLLEQLDMAVTNFRAIADAGATYGKSAFKVYQALAIAQTTIATYQSAVDTYKSFAGLGPWGVALGIVAAAAAVASGLARVAMIRSQEPSYDTGGVSTTPGMYYAGVPEAHIPLDSGGTVPVTISESDEDIYEERPIQITFELEGDAIAQYIYERTKDGDQIVHTRGITEI